MTERPAKRSHVLEDTEENQKGQLSSGLEDLLKNARSGARKLVSMSARAERSRPQEEAAIRRGMIRFLVIIVDCSENVNQRDMRPTRLAAMHQIVSIFLQDFFDQNPISQVALIELREGKADKISELSGNVRRHQKRLDDRVISECKGLGKGLPSIRAGLELALRLLELQASYGTREVLLLYGSLSTCDRGDIFDTIVRLRAGGVRVNIVGIAAEMFIARTICKETGGCYDIATHVDELRRHVLRHTTPPPTPSEQGDKPASAMWVGFPQRVREPLPGFQCPRCQSIYPHVPIDCTMCGLKLLSSSHLARSYHHLFPVRLFAAGRGPPPAARCHACGAGFAAGGDGGGGDDDDADSDGEWHQCPGCEQVFCPQCDGFIHESLHVCPGCEARDCLLAAAGAGGANDAEANLNGPSSVGADPSQGGPAA